MVHQLDEAKHLVGGATKRVVVVVLKPDGESGFGRLLADPADAASGALEGFLPLGFARG